MKSLLPVEWGRKHAAPARWNNWFDRFFEVPIQNFFPMTVRPFACRLPSLDVAESTKEVTVKVEIPGMNEKDLDLTWHDGVLVIRGEKKNEKEEKDKGRIYRECSYGSFSRTIPVGKNVNWEKANTMYKNGVLTVVLPKTETASKVIEIK